MASDIRIALDAMGGDHGPTVVVLAAAVLRGEPVKTTPQDAIENMTVIDAIYRAAGLPLRSPS